MQAFVVIWIGQTISSLGSAMSWFVFTLWAWETTGAATALALVSSFAFAPTLLLGPVAGALVDRWDRKAVMVFSDLAAALFTALVLLLYQTDRLEMWHLYLIGTLAGVATSLQLPAYSAAITMLLPEKAYVRANGMTEASEALSAVLAPFLAAILFKRIGMGGIILIDVLTLLVALGTLLFVRIPRPPVTKAGRQGQGNLWRESLYGFRYLWERPGLLGLELTYAGINFFDSLGFALLVPMILARTGSEVVLGSVQSAGAIGAIVGGVVLVVWGGPKRRIHGVLIGCVLSALLGTSLMGLGRGLLLWMTAHFFAECFDALVNGLDESIWQLRVAPDVQGRVFATRPLISEATVLAGMFLAGPLADRVFEPAMAAGGRLGGAFNWLVGTGPGAGMAVVFVLAGIAEGVIALGGYAFRLPKLVAAVQEGAREGERDAL